MPLAPRATCALPAPPVVHPRQKLLQRPAVDDARQRDARKPGMRDGRLAVTELIGVVRVAVQRKETSRCERAARKYMIEILARRIAVQFHRHRQGRRMVEHTIPVSRDTGA